MEAYIPYILLLRIYILSYILQYIYIYIYISDIIYIAIYLIYISRKLIYKYMETDTFNLFTGFCVLNPQFSPEKPSERFSLYNF